MANSPPSRHAIWYNLTDFDTRRHHHWRKISRGHADISSASASRMHFYGARRDGWWARATGWLDASPKATTTPAPRRSIEWCWAKSRAARALIMPSDCDTSCRRSSPIRRRYIISKMHQKSQYGRYTISGHETYHALTSDRLLASSIDIFEGFAIRQRNQKLRATQNKLLLAREKYTANKIHWRSFSPRHVTFDEETGLIRRRRNFSNKR